MRAKFANFVLVSCNTISILMLVFGIYRSRFSLATVNLIYLIAPVYGIALFTFALKWRQEIKINFSLTILSLVFTIYLFEFFVYLTGSPGNEIHEQLSQQSDIRYDTRTNLQVVEDLGKEGIDAYPFVNPNHLLQHLIKSNKDCFELGELGILPLGTISNKTTILDNEGGEYTMYMSDEHGFNNPPGLFSKEKPDIVLIGDSFAQGWCVKKGEDIGAQLRKKGFTVLNLGIGGMGPLLELATLKEYAEFLRPQIVLWIYYEGNDLDELSSTEKRSSLLMRYLNKGFLQGLWDKQKEIDRILIDSI